MKKAKRRRAETAPPRPAETVSLAAASPSRKFLWWPWAAALAALVVAFVAYGPALDGQFVFDDRYLPFFSPFYQGQPLLRWMTGLRPMLMFSFWLNYAGSG